MGFKMNEFNSFTSKVLEMRSSGKEELLSSYLASMVRSKSFSQYREVYTLKMGCLWIHAKQQLRRWRKCKVA